MNAYASSKSIVLLIAAIVAVGCSNAPEMDYSSMNLVDAHGTVTLDGQPLEGAVVTFESPDGNFSYAMTDAQGKYRLQFDSDMNGVPPGTKTVQISTTRKILGLNTEEAEGGEAPEEEGAAGKNSQQEKVPAKYNENSELTVEVTADQTEYNFDLTS